MGTVSDGGNKQEARAPRIGCFMAYTLNNAQPVLCTLVSDQPYFYMEEAGSSEEDIISDLETYEGFERDMEEIRRKLDALQGAPSIKREDAAQIMERLQGEIKLVTTGRQEPSFSYSHLDELLDILRKSRTAKAMIDSVLEAGVKIVFSDSVFAAAYDRANRVMMVNPNLGQMDRIIFCIRELRRHWQHRNGALLSPMNFHPDQAVLVNRAQKADLSIFTVRVCWELQLSGLRDVWDHMEQHGSLGETARAFAREAFLDFRSLANGRASAAAFENWFLSDRCVFEDKKLIQKMLSDYDGYVLQNETASCAVAKDVLAALGEQPWGANYLKPSIPKIMDDPLFTEVRDRSNANFLWFIKFERAIHETEEALQNGPDTIGSEFPPGAGVTAPAPFQKNTIIDLGERGIIYRAQDARGSGHSCADLDAASIQNVIEVTFGNNRAF